MKYNASINHGFYKQMHMTSNAHFKRPLRCPHLNFHRCTESHFKFSAYILREYTLESLFEQCSVERVSHDHVATVVEQKGQSKDTNEIELSELEKCCCLLDKITSR